MEKLKRVLKTEFRCNKLIVRGNRVNLVKQSLNFVNKKTTFFFSIFHSYITVNHTSFYLYGHAISNFAAF